MIFVRAYLCCERGSGEAPRPDLADDGGREEFAADEHEHAICRGKTYILNYIFGISPI